MQGLMQQMAEQGGKPISEMTPEEARQLGPGLAALTGDPVEVATITDDQVPVDGGSILVRTYEDVENPPATLIYYHGGGWVVGSVADYDGLTRLIAKETGFRVVSVDYRLAPEHVFPAAVEDSWAATKWVADKYPGSPLIVAGDSAGGNLAAIMTQRARAAGGPAIAYQLLVYPVTDADFSTDSYTERGEGYLLDRGAMVWFFDHYLPDVPARSHTDMSPLRAESFEGLPPAYVMVAEYDPLRDEGIAYAKKLEEAGIPVKLKVYDDQAHGFFQMFNFITTANDAIADAAREMRATLKL
jgi:acetyl esterase